MWLRVDKLCISFSIKLAIMNLTNNFKMLN